MLNPETNSDSDSLKSKGARCVSAKVQITHKGKKYKNKRLDIFITEEIEKEKTTNIIIIRIVLKTAS